MDPVSADEGSGDNFNRYWYGNNNPYGFTDPDGRLACSGAVPKSECVRPASPWGDGKKPSFQAEGKEHDPIADYENEHRKMAGRLVETSTAVSHTVAEEVGGMAAGWGAVRALRSIGSWFRFQRALSKIEIKDHAFRVLPGRITKIEQDAVGKAIKADIARRGLPPVGGVMQNTISVNGRTYSYRAFGLPSGNASVGTAVPGHFGRDISVAPP